MDSEPSLVMWLTLSPITLLLSEQETRRMSQQELISIFDDAKSSFNSQGDRSDYL